MNTIELLTDDGLHLPALHVPCPTGPGRPLILIQEIFGINGAMRQAAQAWAAEGFEVLCPDLFARQERGVELDPRQPADFQRGVTLMQGLDQERAVADLDAARQWLTRQDSQRPVCALGYCLGGRLAVMMALTTPIAASVSYYGVGLEGLIPDTPVKSAPCLLHIAENDAFVPAEHAAVEVDHLELPALLLEALAFVGQLAEGGQRQAGDEACGEAAAGQVVSGYHHV